MSHVLGAWFTHNTFWPFFTGPFIAIFRISYSTDHVKNFEFVNSSIGECWILSMSGRSFSLQLNHCYWIHGRLCLGYTIYSIRHFCFPAECCYVAISFRKTSEKVSLVRSFHGCSQFLIHELYKSFDMGPKCYSDKTVVRHQCTVTWMGRGIV